MNSNIYSQHGPPRRYSWTKWTQISSRIARSSRRQSDPARYVFSMDRFSTSRSRLAQATGPAKVGAVKNLVNTLCEDIERPVMLQENRDEALEELKLYARDPEGCDALYTESSISMLLHRAFRSLATSTSHRALRVLVNALRLNAGTRQLVIDQGAAVKICDALQKGDWQDEFLYSRILFLLTYDTDLDLDDLIDNHRLANNIVDNVRRHARLVGSQAKFKINLAEEQALKETLKLLFNVTHYCQDHTSAFTPSIAHIVPLLWKKNIDPRDPLSDSFGPLVNALLNLGLEQDRLAVFPINEPKKLVLRLIELLGYSLRAYSDDIVETNTPPLIDLLRKLYDLSLSPSQHAMRDMLLPSAEDHQAARSQPDTTAARLLKFSTNPATPAMREATSRIYFSMCGEDAETFVKVFGTVFSASFLLEQHLPIPMSAEEAYCTSSETSPLTEAPRALEIESQRLLERFDISLQRTGLFDSDAESSAREATLDGLELEELFPVAQAKQQTSNNEINFHQDDEALIDHLLSPNSRHEPETALDEQADCIASNPIKTNITGVDEISSSPAADAQSDTCQRISVPPSDETTLIAADPCTPQPKSQRSTVTRKAYTRKQYDRSNLRRSTRASVVKQTQKAHALAPKAAISDTAPIARSRKRGRPRRILKPTPSLAAPKPSSRFEVESILDSCIEADTYVHYYLVKWKGFPMRQSTWERKCTLMEDASEAVHEYHDQHGYKRH